MCVFFSSKQRNFGLEASVSVGTARKRGKRLHGKVTLVELWTQKQAHQHLVLELNFTASLWCHWWELPVSQPVRKVSFACLRLSWPSQALSGGIKISIYQVSTEAVWGLVGGVGVAHSQPLLAVGLRWWVQHAGMCPCMFFFFVLTAFVI